MPLLEQPTLAIIGCGTMGIAILSGIFNSLDKANSDPLFPRSFIATVSRDESAENLRILFADRSVRVLCNDNARGIADADVILLCSKPQTAQNILFEEGVRDALANKCLISICAGITISQMQSWVHESTTVIRAMPNTPCKIREGMTVISAPSNARDEYKTLSSHIFSTLGRCRFLEEKHLDAVTGLSGSGPAFACVVLEALADGGVMMGLPRDVALELSAQVLQGAARMVLTTGIHPAALKDSVTTPGGCTIAGLLTMEDGKIRSTLARTIQEASRVASTLGGPKPIPK